jgi:hypothetical protein
MTMMSDFEVCQLQSVMHFDPPVFYGNKTLVNDEGSYRKVQSEPRAQRLQQQSHARSPARFNSGNKRRFRCTPPNFAHLPCQNHACTPPERLRSRRVCLKGGLRPGRQPTPQQTRPMPLARPTEALYFTGDNGGSVS